jgi:uncharacterized protein YbjQ (UPF0145 family)
MRRALILAVAATSLTGCGTTAHNSDVGLARTWVDPKKTVTDTATVALVDTGPPLSSTAERVSGHSCKNKMWDPEPSRENAIALMKQEASSKGYNAVHSVQVVNDPAAIVKNCWSALIATGIAFKR